MNKQNKYITCFILLTAVQLIWSLSIKSQDFDFKGQLTTWTVSNPDQDFQTQMGLRYIPEIAFVYKPWKTLMFDSEFSVDTFGTTLFRSNQKAGTDSDIKIYRMWLRISSTQMEARVGLQKINFGSANLLRPLMWFDRIDPRDPLQLTQGVYGILIRYYFLNNANIWLWGLYGNNHTKGWEFIPTEKNKIEWGGRIQHPIPRGEFAITFHQRQINIAKGMSNIIRMLNLPANLLDLTSNLYDIHPVSERRFGLDGKWDILIGLWIEATIMNQNTKWLPYTYQRIINIGADYTFGLGNGLHILYEHFWLDMTEQVFGKGEGIAFSAVSANYPIGLLDNVTGMVYFDWENREWYRFINFQRTYDRIGLYFIGFWNPIQFQLYQNQSENNLFAGKGFQIMLVFNH